MTRRILLIGRSEKFERLIRQHMAQDDTLEITPWRSPAHPANAALTHIVIAGYDFTCCRYGLRNYLMNSYLKVYRLLAAYNAAASIIYINTHCQERRILSRYAFAKERLALLLKRRFSVIELQPEVILAPDGKPDLRSGWLARSIIAALIATGLLKTTSYASLSESMRLALTGGIPPSSHRPAPRGLLLAMPRTALMDKIMRLLQKFL